MKYVFVFLLVLSVIRLSQCLPHNSTVSISKYAKVAVWGRNKTNDQAIQGGRSITNDRIWNARVGSKNIRPHTKKKNPSVAYQYPVYQGPASEFHQKVEYVPGIGEVIVGQAQAQAQDRFEARPLFAYKNKLASATYGPPVVAKTTPPVMAPPVVAPTRVSPISATPATSFSSFSNPSVASPPPPPPDQNPSFDLYNSPYSSYNPPDFKPDDSGTDDIFPPSVLPSQNPDQDMKSAAQVPSMESPSDSTEAPKANAQDSYASFASYGTDPNHPDPGVFSYGNHAPAQDPMAMYKNHDGPPEFPPKDENDIYYPPDFPKDQVPSMHDNGDDMMKQVPHDSMMEPPPDSMMEPPQDSMPSQQDSMDNGKDNGDSPPMHDYGHGHAFPQYLYDDHHHYDHVYEEIPHTTMAPVKEDKRVSSTHYSYYYLGRKLWHKVRLKYKWYEHDTSAKEARSLDLGDIREERLMDLHQNVSVALKTSGQKYNNV